MKRLSLMPRMLAVALGSLIALAALGATAFAQPAPPHQFYGAGTDGDTVAIAGTDYSTEVSGGEWFLRVSQAMADNVGDDSFTVNGEAATAVRTPQGASLTHVALTVVMEEEAMVDNCPDEGMMSDDTMSDDTMSDDTMSDDTMSDDTMADDSLSDDEAMSDGEAMVDCPEDGSM